MKKKGKMAGGEIRSGEGPGHWAGVWSRGTWGRGRLSQDSGVIPELSSFCPHGFPMADSVQKKCPWPPRIHNLSCFPPLLSYCLPF